MKIAVRTKPKPEPKECPYREGIQRHTKECDNCIFAKLNVHIHDRNLVTECTAGDYTEEERAQRLKLINEIRRYNS